MVRRIVVLPQPDGPRKLKNSPFLILSVADCTAMKSPKRMVTPIEFDVGAHPLDPPPCQVSFRVLSRGQPSATPTEDAASRPLGGAGMAVVAAGVHAGPVRPP